MTLSGRGGERKGSGRPKTNKTSTKATIYLEERENLNSLAKELNMPVNEMLHQIIKNKNFPSLIEDIKNDPNKDSWRPNKNQ